MTAHPTTPISPTLPHPQRRERAQRPELVQRREIDSLVGLVIFLGATAMLFAALLFAYAVVRAQSPAWPPLGTPPFPRATAGASGLLLLAASFALRRDRARVAFVLGAGFLVFQSVLWRHLVVAGLGPGAGALGDVFVALSSFHALHVFGGLIAVAGAGGRRARRPLTLYWDFVFVVWLIIYATVCVF